MHAVPSLITQQCPLLLSLFCCTMAFRGSSGCPCHITQPALYRLVWQEKFGV